MCAIHTSVVTHAHAYTRSRSPWIMAAPRSVCGRLVHYLAGGGIGAFGRTVRQEEVRRRQTRFLAASAVVAAGWLLLLVL